jgi:hypothetical protein
METITISPKFRIVIPGQKVHAIAYEDRIELIPVRPERELRGFLLYRTRYPGHKVEVSFPC